MSNKDGNNNGPKDWEDDEHPDEIDPSQVYDPTQSVDAGVAEETQAAEEQTRVLVLRKVENNHKREDYADEVRTEPDIGIRGKKLLQGNLITFPDTKFTNGAYVAMNCDKNRITAYEALFGTGPTRPHINTFSGRLTDWKGEIIDDHYSMVPLLDALHNMGLRMQALDSIRKSFRDWGMQVKQNDLILSFQNRLPEWDGTKRMEEKLIKLFGSFDTQLNRDFGVYFWLSLYCRINYPGCMAPMALSIFGGQDAGKSYFSKLLCRVILQDENTSSVQLDMGADKISFLRDITGQSIVANIGEMTGFGRADLNDIKQFMTATSDGMHQKFEGHYQQQRQWIAIMDGNKYEGLQRDETGNRRFYPMFAGQLPDKHGQPDWDIDFRADFTGFADDVWQLMAEAKAWLEANGGLSGYHNYVDSTSQKVKEFSRSEMEQGRGVVGDYALDTYLVPALKDLGKLNACILNGRVKKGVWITGANLKTRIRMMSRGSEVKDNHLKTQMIVLGAKADMVDNVRGYLFANIMDEKAYLRHISRADIDDDDDVKIEMQFTDQGDF
jgi:hypothetical protein